MWPAGIARPNASNLNVTPGQNVPNLVEVSLGAGDQVNIYNANGTVDVVADLEGYVAPVATPGTGLYNPLPPTRICDLCGGCRNLAEPMRPRRGEPRHARAGGHPHSPGHRPGWGARLGVSAVVMNVTVAGPTATSHLTAWPTGVSRPTASNLNWRPNTNIANRVIVQVGSDGQVSFYIGNGNADVIADVGGWFTDASVPAATGDDYGRVADPDLRHAGNRSRGGRESATRELPRVP